MLGRLFQDKHFMQVAGLLLLGGGFFAYQWFTRLGPKDFDQFKLVGGIGLGVIALAALGWAAFVFWRNFVQSRQRKAVNARVAAGPTYWLLPNSEAKTLKLSEVRFWERAVPAGEHFAWEFSGHGDRQQFTLHASAEAIESVLTHVEAEWDDAQQRRTGDKFPDPLKAEGTVYWIELGPATATADIAETVSDPLRIIIAELTRWPSTTTGVVQVLIRSDAGNRQALRQQALGARSQLRRVPGAAAADPGVSRQARQQADALEKRGEQVFLEALVRVAAIAPNAEQAKLRAGQLATAVRQAFGDKNPLTVLGQGEGRTGLTARAFMSKGRPWGAQELAVLAHLPGKEVIAAAPRLQTASAKYLVADPPHRILPGDQVAEYISEHYPFPADLRGGTGAVKIAFGHNVDKAGIEALVGMSLKDMQKHGFVVGSTGSGKSTLLRVIGCQCYAEGATVFVMEPAGKLCDDMVLTMPESRLGDVVMLDLSAKSPPALPMLTIGLKWGLDQAVDAAMSVLRIADPGNWDQSAQMQNLLRHALRIVIAVERKQASLVKLERFLNNGPYRDSLIARAVKMTNANKSAIYWRDTVCPLLDPDRKKGAGGVDSLKQSLLSGSRRLADFVSNKYLRRCFAVSPLGPAIDMGALLDSGQMVLAPVRKSGKTGMGDKPALVAETIYMWLVMKEFLGRDYADNKQAVVIVDELASMADTDVVVYGDTILRECRKFGASLILGTQSLQQLKSDTQTNVRVNTNFKIILKVQDESDAKDSAKILSDPRVLPGDLMTLKDYHGYFKTPASPKAATVAALDEIVLAEMPPREGVVPLDGRKPELGPEALEILRLAPPLAKSNPQDDECEAEEAVLKYLVRLPEKKFDRAVADLQAYGRSLAAAMIRQPVKFAAYLKTHPDERVLADRLLEWPEGIMDKPKRAVMISGCLYGLPWWLREAHFRREDGGEVFEESDAPAQASPAESEDEV